MKAKVIHTTLIINMKIESVICCTFMVNFYCKL